MNLFAPHLTDGYKMGHPAQYAANTEYVTSNFTPRDFSYAITTPETKTDKMVFVGLQYAIKEYLINGWNNTFFSQPKEKVLAKYARRIKNYLGTNQGQAAQDMMSRLHDLGYLPIKITALPEGSRVNAGIPVFVITNTLPGFGALVNYLETVLSNTVWPICNSASLSEQYYLLAKKYGELTGASSEFWLPFAMHNFALRGHRGMEDGITTAFGHSLFHKGTDSFAVVDFAEEYYSADSDKELIGVSVNASEHATVCQQIAVHGGGGLGERQALKHFLTNVYPTGVFSYVSDSRDYWDVVANITLELKDIILSRGSNVDGQPGVLTIRPDSSPDTPYEILLGYKVFNAKDGLGYEQKLEFNQGEYNAVKYDSKFYTATAEDRSSGINIGRELSEPEAKGTLQVLWENFGGTEVVRFNPSLGLELAHTYKLLDSHIRIIYGEAISLSMAAKIYKGMEKAGWSVGNVLFGIGSWAFLGNSSRDSYGVACKATNSVVGGEDFPLQKDPKGTSSFKKSARGRLRVAKQGDSYVLFDNQTPEEEKLGHLQVVLEDGVLYNESSYSDIISRLAVN